MGLFGNLFNPKKWTLGTIGDLAGVAGAAGSAGLLPMGSTLATGLGIFGGLAGSGGGQSGSTVNMNGDVQSMLDQMMKQDLQFINSNSGKRYGAINNAYNALDPRNDATNASYFQNSLLRNADATGRRDANSMLRRGYGSSVADAARLNARNVATQQGNDYFANLTNPANRASRYMGQADLLGNQSMFQNSLSGMLSLQNASNSQRLADLQYNANRPPSFLESLLGIAGQVAPYMVRDQKENTSGGSPLFGSNTRPGIYS